MNGQPRLLVCDDEADFRDYIAHVARALGYAVRQVGDSRDCVAAVAEFAPDVVVLDVIMPDVDGVEIVQRLAAAHYGGHVIIASGYNPHYARSAEVLGKVRGMRMTTLPKPVALAELRAALA